jgi:hypothetical protein
MPNRKALRDAHALACRELARLALDLAVAIRCDSHARLIVSTPDGRFSRFVVFASTPSCNRWLVHLKKDLRQVLAQFEALFRAEAQRRRP